MKTQNLRLKFMGILFLIIHFLTPLHSQSYEPGSTIATSKIEMPDLQVKGTIDPIPAFHFNETVVIRDEKGKSAKQFSLAGDEKYFILYSHTLLPGAYVCQLSAMDHLLAEINFKVLNR